MVNLVENHSNSINISEQDEMCERTRYTDFVRMLEGNHKPTTPTDHYRTLRVMRERYPHNCQLVYANDASCRKPKREGQCQYAVGTSLTSYMRSEITADPWENATAIPQGQICFDKDIHMNQIIRENIRSTALEMVGVREESELRHLMKQRLQSLPQVLNNKGQNQANDMNRALALLGEKLNKMRSQGLIGSHLRSLRARYAARRAVTRTGSGGINWELEFVNVQGNMNRTLAIMRKLELEISDVTEDVKRKIAEYHLYKRIRAMLPHLEKVTSLEKGRKYRIRLKKGEIILQQISRFNRKSGGNVEQTRTQDTTNEDGTKTTTPVMTMVKHETTMKNTRERQVNSITETTRQEKTEQLSHGVTTLSNQEKVVVPTQEMIKSKTQLDEYQRINQLMEEELKEHQMIPKNLKKKAKEGKKRDKIDKNQTEVLLKVLIIMAGAAGGMSLISLTC